MKTYTSRAELVSLGLIRPFEGRYACLALDEAGRAWAARDLAEYRRDPGMAARPFNARREEPRWAS